MLLQVASKEKPNLYFYDSILKHKRYIEDRFDAYITICRKLFQIVSQFQDIRTFATGGSKHIASINTNNEHFVFLNNPDIEALQIFSHNFQYDNFYDYQNLYFQSRVIGVSAFYTGGKIIFSTNHAIEKLYIILSFLAYAQSEILVVTVTRDGWFYVHEYMLHGVNILNNRLANYFEPPIINNI